MHRRTIIGAALAAVFATTARSRGTNPTMSTAMDSFEQRRAKINADAIAQFPFERVVVRGEDALSTWRKLKSEGRGVPVVIGDDDAVVTMMGAFDPHMPDAARTVESILEAAAKFRIPDDLFERRRTEDVADQKATKELIEGPDKNLPTVIATTNAKGEITSYTQVWGSSNPSPDILPHSGNGRVLTPAETRAFFARGLLSDPQIGVWPSETPQATGLTVATNILTGKPLPKVHIALIPTDDWTAVPAYLRWGGWNDCPSPEIHVAALRSWRDRFGVELAGISNDTMNLTCARPPATREVALALAREQYAYCTDIVDQGTETLSALAAALMTDWWFFWWD